MTRTTDRDALIETAAAVMRGNGSFMGGWHADYCEDGQCGCDHEVAADVLDAVLPLIADAIEALDKWPPSGPFGESLGIERAANLVRTLARPGTGE